jgi:crotonobetainyl-CoA:carnitine CoA-transferase CaiB-like acyl-CoA transferase
MVLKDERGWDHIGVPIQFMDEPGRASFRSPAHGEHSREIVRELGYRAEEIEQLRKKGVIQHATPEEVAAHGGA